MPSGGRHASDPGSCPMPSRANIAPSARPVKTLSTVDEETEQLRELVAKLQDRLAVLETIATDPAERTAREIESLRDLPPGSGGPVKRS